MTSRLLRFGFEIEGEFSPYTQARLSLEDNVDIDEDGSIRSCLEVKPRPQLSDSSTLAHTKLNLRECRFGIFNRGDDVSEYFKLLGYWGKDFHANRSSGFHVHLSFDPKWPPELISSDFFLNFMAGVKREFPEEYKARNGNRYCKFFGARKSDKVDEEIYKGRQTYDRYRAINLASLSKHGTVEFRLWPSNRPAMMKKYLDFTLDFVQDYINTPHTFILSLSKRPITQTKLITI